MRGRAVLLAVILSGALVGGSARAANVVDSAVYGSVYGGVYEGAGSSPSALLAAPPCSITAVPADGLRFAGVAGHPALSETSATLTVSATGCSGWKVILWAGPWAIAGRAAGPCALRWRVSGQPWRCVPSSQQNAAVVWETPGPHASVTFGPRGADVPLELVGGRAGAVSGQVYVETVGIPDGSA
jgi:hypothetical protein